MRELFLSTSREGASKLTCESEDLVLELENRLDIYLPRNVVAGKRIFDDYAFFVSCVLVAEERLLNWRAVGVRGLSAPSSTWCAPIRQN